MALRNAALPRGDAEILLAHAVGKPRTWILAHAGDELTEEESARFTRHVERRKTGEPIAYVTGEREFAGRIFRVSSATLIPRPATETLIACVQKTMSEKKGVLLDADTGIVCGSAVLGNLEKTGTLADIGTGSGVIAVTLAHLFSDKRVIATDISHDALRVAKENAVRHGVHIDLRNGSLLDPMANEREPFFIISNPPYVPTDFPLEKTVSDFEPMSAITAGKDGMDVLRPLIHACASNPLCSGFAVECRTEQWKDIQRML